MIHSELVNWKNYDVSLDKEQKQLDNWNILVSIQDPRQRGMQRAFKMIATSVERPNDKGLQNKSHVLEAQDSQVQVVKFRVTKTQVVKPWPKKWVPPQICEEEVEVPSCTDWKGWKGRRVLKV